VIPVTSDHVMIDCDGDSSYDGLWWWVLLW